MKPRAILAALFILTVLIIAYVATAPRREIGLKRFYELTKTDPLLYDELLDTKDLDTELKKIEEKEILFRQLTAFPYPFLALEHLKVLPALKRQTEDFLANPDTLKALKLLNLQKKFVNKYKKAATTHRDALEKVIAPSQREQKIRFLGSATTPQIILDDLNLILRNAEALENEITLREKCLLAGNCPSPKSPKLGLEQEWPKLSLGQNLGQNLLPPEILAPGRYDTFRGPYAAKTGCFGFNEDGAPKTQLFYIFEKNENGKKIIFPKLATENYYFDFETERESWPFGSAMLARGIRYDHQRETNDYRCSDLTYWPELLEADRLAQGGAPGPAKLWTLPLLLRVMPALDFIAGRAEIIGPPDPLYLLTVATPYSVFYLTFSPMAWRLEEKPTFLDGQNYPLQKTFAIYHGLKEKGVGDEELKKASFRAIPELRQFVENFKKSQSDGLPIWESWKRLERYLFPKF